MATRTTLEQLEQQITQLPMRDQLKLIARISERLSITMEKPGTEDADELLALCDAAAEMWEGEFDTAQEIRQMRRERDEQIWPNKS